LKKYPINFIFKSTFTKFLVNNFPVFRGHIPILNLLLKVIPFSKKVTMLFDLSEYYLDLRYSTHLSCVKLRSYEELETVTIINILKKGDCFIDIGSNWGYFSAITSKVVGTEGTVFSVEANPNTFMKMSSMLRVSKVSNVLTFNFAVCEQDNLSIDF
jgi:hypothetical protein